MFCVLSYIISLISFFLLPVYVFGLSFMLPSLKRAIRSFKNSLVGEGGNKCERLNGKVDTYIIVWHAAFGLFIN